MNLHPLSTAELRSNMIAILNEVHSFCEENHLRYLLAFGTLLGAVRHKGFIPWDDDIDIWMPRKDYDLFEATFQHPFLQVLSAEKDHNYPLDFMKVHDTRTIVKEKGGDGEWGIFIDIFPLDDFPSSQVWKIACKRVSRIRHFVANQRFTRKMILTSSNGLKKNIAIIAGKLIHPFVSLHQLLISEMKAMKCYHMDENPFVSDLTDLSPILIPRSSVEERIHLTFESYSFWGPKDYDQWLTSLFGNYMELPPVAERVSNHMIEAFWIND